MEAAIYNFDTQMRGDTFEEVLFELLVNDVAVNLTGAEIKMQFRVKPLSPVVLELSNETDSGITVTDAAAGKFKIDAIEDFDLTPGTYMYDIQITMSTGEVVTYVRGSLTVRQDITR